MTGAERQRAYRQRRQDSGTVVLAVRVNPTARQFLDECYGQCAETMDGWGETLTQWLLRGAAFSANAGCLRPKQRIPEAALRRNDLGGGR